MSRQAIHHVSAKQTNTDLGFKLILEFQLFPPFTIVVNNAGKLFDTFTFSWFISRILELLLLRWLYLISREHQYSQGGPFADLKIWKIQKDFFVRLQNFFLVNMGMLRFFLYHNIVILILLEALSKQEVSNLG